MDSFCGSFGSLDPSNCTLVDKSRIRVTIRIHPGVRFVFALAQIEEKAIFMKGFG
jgi:hypothetical protein